MSTQPAPERMMTAEEFIAWDGDGYQGRLELVNGEVRSMSPASGTHALIQATVSRLIGNHLSAKRLPCRIGTEAPIQPRIRPGRNVRVPDIAVTCAPPRDDERFFPDPVLIIEVFSPGNRRETLETVWACATIPTLVEIVLVESERIAAEVYHKDERAGWPETGQAIGADGALRLESIGFAVPLAELYAGTHLALPGS